MATQARNARPCDIRFVSADWEPPESHEWIEYTFDADSVFFWAAQLSGDPERCRTDDRPRLVRVELEATQAPKRRRIRGQFL